MGGAPEVALRWVGGITAVAGFVGMVAVGACGPAAETSTNGSTGEGVVVDRFRQAWSGGEGWVVDPHAHVRIGVMEGRADYELVNVSAAAMQSDGDIVVADGAARVVRLYDSSGRFLRTLGGPGGGPGEFQNPTQVVVTRADSTLVWDNAHFRITRFDPDGGFVGVESVSRGAISAAIDPPLFPATAALVRSDRLMVRLVEKTKELPPGVFRRRSGALLVSTTSTEIDTLMFFSDVEQVSVQAPWGMWPVVPPSARGTLAAVQAATSTVCFGDQKEPEVVCFGPDGRQKVLRWPADAEPLTEREVIVWRDTASVVYGMKLNEQQIAEMLAQVEPPATRPYFTGMTIDLDGNLWVERDRGNRALGRPVEHLVFDTLGVLLGPVTLPPMGVLEIGTDYVLGVYHDEFDVEYVQVHHLVK